MCWTKQEWTDNGGKHIPQTRVTIEEAKQLSLQAGRNRKPASQYVLGQAEVEQLEVDVVNNGDLIRERGGHTRFYFRICDEVVGADGGVETNVLKVQWSKSGAIHGYPISRNQLMRELKTHNRPIYERLRGGG